MIAVKEIPVISPSMEDLLSALREAERLLTYRYEPFTLFGLFEREGVQERWDLIASAPWLEKGRKGIEVMAQVIAKLPKEEATQISRIVILAPESAAVQAIVDAATVIDKGFAVVGPMLIGRAEVTRGYLLVSQKGQPIMQPLGMRG